MKNKDKINPLFDREITICKSCGAKDSIHWEKRTIEINDKHGSFKELTFNYCEECGDVTNVDFS